MVSLLVNTLVTSLKYVSRAASVLLVSNVLELLMYEATRVLVKKRLVPSMRLVVEMFSDEVLTQLTPVVVDCNNCPLKPRVALLS